MLAAMGDGAFAMSMSEIETAVREGVHFVVLVWVDGGYGLIGWKQDIHFGRQSAVSFTNPDFVKLAESFGAKGYEIGCGERTGAHPREGPRRRGGLDHRLPGRLPRERPPDRTARRPDRVDLTPAAAGSDARLEVLNHRR